MLHVREKGELSTGFLLEKHRKKKTTWKTQTQWVDNTEMEMQGVCWEDVVWIDLAQDRDKLRAVVKAVMNLLVP